MHKRYQLKCFTKPLASVLILKVTSPVTIIKHVPLNLMLHAIGREKLDVLSYERISIVVHFLDDI